LLDLSGKLRPQSTSSERRSERHASKATLYCTPPTLGVIVNLPAGQQEPSFVIELCVPYHLRFPIGDLRLDNHLSFAISDW
jgi:hypothetical protein